MKTLPITKYFEIIKPPYVYVKITPLKSIRNYNSDKIIVTVADLYKSLTKRIIRDHKKFFINVPVKISYYIYMEKGKAEFYFVIPKDYYTLFSDKISDTWRSVTAKIVDTIPFFNADSLKYNLRYGKEDAFSLITDKRNNSLLSSVTSVMGVMEEGDRIGIVYNFMPQDQKYWKGDYDYYIKRFKDGYPIEKEKKSGKYIGLMALKLLTAILDSIFDAINTLGGICKKEQPLIVRNVEQLKDETRQKRKSKVVSAQIVVFSDSDDKHRANNNAISVCQAFDTLRSDNELIYKKIGKANINITDYKLNGADAITISPSEGQNLISLPGREIIEEHKLECIDMTETEVPEDLRHGYIPLGTNTYHGHEEEAFHRDNYDQGNLPLVEIGEQGAGKTTYMANYVDAIQTRTEGAMVIDFIKNCELSDTIKAAVKDKSRLIEVDMTDISNVQGIGYNELLPRTNKPLDRFDVSNRKSLYIQMLVDALNADGEPLSSSMDRYLSAASNVVFMDDNASLRDVVRCLNSAEYRQKCIDAIPPELTNMMEDEVEALHELNDDKGGTRTQRIDGINHRINFLRKDLRLKTMFKKDCRNNIDLVKAMDDGKIILVKMPQEYFGTPYSKNVVVTYLFTKIWAAMIVRGSQQNRPKRFHVIVDEIFQAKTAMQLLKTQEILPQTRKFGCRFVFSCQYLGQISVIDQTLRSAGASYMLMKGTGKANFNEFKDELAPFTLDDMESLKQYECLNLINYERGRAKFVTHLPPPIK